MEKDIQHIVKNRHHLVDFFNCPNERHMQLHSVRPEVLHAIHTLIRFTHEVLKNYDEEFNYLRHHIGEHIDHIQSARNEHESRRNMHNVHELTGGSFWGKIGNFFKSAASKVGNAFKSAGETVYNKVLKPAGKFIYDNRKVIGDVISKGVDILSALPIPVVQEVALAAKPFTSAGNKLIQGTGLHSRMPTFLSHYPMDNLNYV